MATAGSIIFAMFPRRPSWRVYTVQKTQMRIAMNRLMPERETRIA